MKCCDDGSETACAVFMQPPRSSSVANEGSLAWLGRPGELFTGSVQCERVDPFNEMNKFLKQLIPIFWCNLCSQG